jgi:sporulation protein YlmC with PRC-barrel domain
MARNFDDDVVTSSSNLGMGTNEVGSTDYDRDQRPRRVLSASTLEGDSVRNSAGEDLGKIEDIMVDIPTGRVAYAVLSFGGFLGIGNKLFAVPWAALTLDEDAHEFILNVDKAVLESAPGFDKDSWPDMADPSWGEQIHSHYGFRPYWDEAGRAPVAGQTPARRNKGKTLTGGGGL